LEAFVAVVSHLGHYRIVYAPAPPKALEEIKKSHFYAGPISVTACAYDLTMKATPKEPRQGQNAKRL
jgi:hypothetical protein